MPLRRPGPNLGLARPTAGLPITRGGGNLDNENEIEDREALSLLGFVVMGKAESRILKNGNFRIAQELSASKIENIDKLEEFCRCMSKCQNKEMGK